MPDLYFLGGLSNPVNNFEGWIDDIIISPFVYTQQQIAQYVNNGHKTVTVQPGNQVLLLLCLIVALRAGDQVTCIVSNGHDITRATLCGNGVLNDGELCDVGLFGNKTCSDFGFVAGSVTSDRKSMMVFFYRKIGLRPNMQIL
jgi:hypothetical protein